jgi:hypothetical protein
MTPDVAQAANCDKTPDHPNCIDGGDDVPGGGGGGKPGGNDGGGGSLPLGGDYIVLDTDGALVLDGVNYSYGPDIEELGDITGYETYGWMHDDVGIAFSYGLDGSGSNLIIVDNHEGPGTKFYANLEDEETSGTTELHGYWTSLQASLVAPGADMADPVHWDTKDGTRNLDGTLDPENDTTALITAAYSTTGALNVVNLSFGLWEYESVDTLADEYTIGTILWDSIIDEAHNGTAVFVKAAGNGEAGTVDGTATLRLPKPTKVVDVLNTLMVDAPGAIFVGALDGNGTSTDPARLASYSTIAGDDTAIQDMFLVVGVDWGTIGVEGTSFAAPIVSGYAAIIGQKFTLDDIAPDAADVVDQLLFTARTDTIADFGASCTMMSQVPDSTDCTRSSVYGVGEADLSRAISPIIPPA